MASLALDGPMATPTVNYVVRAAAIGFGDTVVEDVYASGLARVDADRILIPIDARARRVSGLNAAAGGLLPNVRLNGDLSITGPQRDREGDVEGKRVEDSVYIRGRRRLKKQTVKKS